MKRTQSILCGIQLGPRKRDPTRKRTCGWTRPSWRDEEVFSAGAPGIFPCTAEMSNNMGFRRFQAKERATPASKPSSSWKALTNAEKCGAGELVHEPDGAHDVQGGVPYSMPWFQNFVRSGAPS